MGIDISPTACRVMAKRLRDGYALPESECSGMGSAGVPPAVFGVAPNTFPPQFRPAGRLMVQPGRSRSPL